jgi:hypothetical protein
MHRHAVPVIVAAVLLSAGGGAATWALAGDDSATHKGNEAPIDDNHQGSPGPAVPAPEPSGTEHGGHS